MQISIKLLSIVHSGRLQFYCRYFNIHNSNPFIGIINTCFCVCKCFTQIACLKFYFYIDECIACCKTVFFIKPKVPALNCDQYFYCSQFNDMLRHLVGIWGSLMNYNLKIINCSCKIIIICLTIHPLI